MSTSSISEFQRHEAEQKRESARTVLTLVRKLRADPNLDADSAATLKQLEQRVEQLRLEADQLEGLSVRVDYDKEA
jgi:hypothetical protein